ncbi:nucleotidyltransferase family protein [Biformimicrobium ophioploci]|uniref:Nucleotidyltransferase family protein n=1 Tax=Biformimicrobium ophioploci TaxID=3036711 RepID=A0ABQ6LV57_9GAMM|nr:nucleotidyltransferase family protein [Microbulbifer sp. NKW57]GMG85965.1 nucleotidyltransferase family protein [Microbulbifer sp. NKW57]
MSKLATVVLAAGAASRFGQCKLLLAQDGKTLLQRRVDAVRSAGLAEPVIITGAWHARVHENHADLDLRFNPDWAQGIGGSIAFAITQLPESAEAVLFLLADQVAVTAEDLRTLVKQWEQHGGVVSALYQGEPGVPAIFPRRLFGELLQLHGDRGAKKLLNNDGGDAIYVPMAGAAIDIDTTEDWNNWLANGEQAWS